MISKQGENLVFLLGIPRSGTTLLSVMLDGHSQLRCPPEPWLMLALESIGRVSARNPADAPVLYRALRKFSDSTTTASAVRSYATTAYNQAIKGTGKKILIDKTPRYYLILPYLTEVFPKAKFIILWRNPLDIAASIRNTWQVDIAAHLAGCEDHLNCIDLVIGLRRLIEFSRSNTSQVHSVFYEKLVSQPRDSFASILKWLNVPHEPPNQFDLVSSEFDRGDIGDKKILSTTWPHERSVGQWTRTFSPAEIAGIVEGVGSHIFTTLGYAAELAEAVRLSGKISNPAHSNAYAERLAQALDRRNGEYDSVVSFSDLTLQERRLQQSLFTATASVQQTSAVDLSTELRAAADAADVLSNAVNQGLSRISELDRDAAVVAARLEEARGQVTQSTVRETDWANRFAAQAAELEAARQQLSQLGEQLKRSVSELEISSADRSSQCIATASLSHQLEEAHATLHITIGDLQGHRQRVVDLCTQLQQAESELTRARASDARLQAQLEQSQQELSNIFSRLEESEKKLRLMSRPHVNRRPWPYTISDALPLPATLPGGKPWPKISIITASYNQGRYIEQTILSVVNQNYPNLEYILIDGQSTDETMEIVEQYREQISLVISERDTGQSNAINKGFARATGELFAWLNSDDMLEKDSLACMAMAFHTSGADMVAGLCTLHTGGVVASRHMTSCISGPLPLEDLLDLDHCWLRGQFFYQPEVMFTRDLWLRAGAHLHEHLYYSMDYELWLRFAEQGARLHVIGKPVARYRVHDQQKTFRISEYLPELQRVRDAFIARAGSAPRQYSRSNGFEPKTHLRALFFNDLGDAGGAGIAHQRLAAAVASAGHEVIPLAICPDLTRCRLTNHAILQAIADRTPDVIFLGNIHSAQLDPAIIGLIAKRWPTLQVLHDLYSLTGRCAYPGGCGQYLSGCDETCPTANEYPALDPTRINHAWNIKQQAMLGDGAPILAAVSNWTAQFAEQRFHSVHLAGPKPTVVPFRYGLPTDTFRPLDMSSSRALLKLPQDRFIVLFSSSNLADARKGLSHLIAALKSVQVPNLLAVCIGQLDADLTGCPFEIRSMGYVSDNNTLAMLYSAADIFVGPSLVETFGQVFIEAAACGTPSVGYASAGGVADAIADGISGFLAPAPSPDSLAGLIQQLHDDPSLRRDIGIWGRLWIENEFSFQSVYHRIFTQLHKIGLLEKLHLSPKVSFYKDAHASPPVTYLDVPPPLPTEAEIQLLRADEQIQTLRRTAVTTQLDTESRILTLQSELVSLQKAHESLGKMHGLLQDETKNEIARLESERESAHQQAEAELAILQAQRDLLKTEIGNITQTRLWRMVGAVYPLYQRTIQLNHLPHAAKAPFRAMHSWLAKKETQKL